MSLLNTRDEHYHESDQLVQRLRNLQWDDVSSDVRDRCWREFNRMLAEREDRISRGGGEARRLDFSRTRPCAEGVVARERLRSARRIAVDRRLRPALV
jgi:hypothetical protein